MEGRAKSGGGYGEKKGLKGKGIAAAADANDCKSGF